MAKYENGNVQLDINTFFSFLKSFNEVTSATESGNEKIKFYEKKIIDLEELNQKTILQIDDLNKKYANDLKTNQNLILDLNNKLRDNEKLHELNFDKLKSEKESLEKSIIENEKKYKENLQEIAKKYTDQINVLKKEKSDITKTFTKTKEEEEKKLLVLQSQNEKTIQNLFNQNESLKKQITKLTTDLQVNNLNSEKAKLELKEANKKITEENAKLNKEIEINKKTISQKDSTLKKLTDDLEKLKTYYSENLKNIEQEKTEFYNKLIEKDKIININEQVLKKLEEEKAKSQLKNDQLENNIKTFETQLNAEKLEKKNIINMYNKRITTIIENIPKTNIEIDKLNNIKYEDLNTIDMDNDKISTELKNRLWDLIKGVRKMTNRLRKTLIERDEYIKKHKDIEDILKQKNNIVRNEEDKSNKEKLLYMQQNKDLQSKLKKIEKNLEEQSNIFKNKENTFTTELNFYQDENTKLKKKAEELQKKLSTIMTENNNFKSERANLEKEINEFDKIDGKNDLLFKFISIMNRDIIKRIKNFENLLPDEFIFIPFSFGYNEILDISNTNNNFKSLLEQNIVPNIYLGPAKKLIKNSIYYPLWIDKSIGHKISLNISTKYNLLCFTLNRMRFDGIMAKEYNLKSSLCLTLCFQYVYILIKIPFISGSIDSFDFMAVIDSTGEMNSYSKSNTIFTTTFFELYNTLYDKNNNKNIYHKSEIYNQKYGYNNNNNTNIQYSDIIDNERPIKFLLGFLVQIMHAVESAELQHYYYVENYKAISIDISEAFEFTVNFKGEFNIEFTRMNDGLSDINNRVIKKILLTKDYFYLRNKSKFESKKDIQSDKIVPRELYSGQYIPSIVIKNYENIKLTNFLKKTTNMSEQVAKMRRETFRNYIYYIFLYNELSTSSLNNYRLYNIIFDYNINYYNIFEQYYEKADFVFINKILDNKKLTKFNTSVHIVIKQKKTDLLGYTYETTQEIPKNITDILNLYMENFIKFKTTKTGTKSIDLMKSFIRKENSFFFINIFQYYINIYYLELLNSNEIKKINKLVLEMKLFEDLIEDDIIKQILGFIRNLETGISANKYDFLKRLLSDFVNYDTQNQSIELINKINTNYDDDNNILVTTLKNYKDKLELYILPLFFLSIFDMLFFINGIFNIDTYNMLHILKRRAMNDPFSTNNIDEIRYFKYYRSTYKTAFEVYKSDNEIFGHIYIPCVAYSIYESLTSTINDTSYMKWINEKIFIIKTLIDFNFEDISKDYMDYINSQEMILYKFIVKFIYLHYIKTKIEKYEAKKPSNKVDDLNILFNISLFFGILHWEIKDKENKSRYYFNLFINSYEEPEIINTTNENVTNLNDDTVKLKSEKIKFAQNIFNKNNKKYNSSIFLDELSELIKNHSEKDVNSENTFYVGRYMRDIDLKESLKTKKPEDVYSIVS